MYNLLELEDGTIYQQPLTNMNFHRFKWLDLENPTPEELSTVAQIIKLSDEDLKVSLDRDELARVTEIEHFSMIIFKSPHHTKHKNVITTTTITFLVSERLLITIHRDPITAVNELRQLGEQHLATLMEKGTGEVLTYLLERIINEYYLLFEDIEEHINKVEDLVFSRPEQRTVKNIFNLKRTLIYFHKGLNANRDVLISLQKGDCDNIDEKTARKAEHLYYDVIQLLDVATTYRDILTGSLDIYLSSVSNNMNAVMKKMAAYGTLVLVPTFITGLYGMNFRYMPELTWKYGYAFAWFTIIASLSLLIWYFKKKNWF